MTTSARGATPTDPNSEVPGGMADVNDEFAEIAHSGGKITLRVTTSADGRRLYQTQYTHQRAARVVVVSLWALRQGYVVERINLGGIGPAS